MATYQQPPPPQSTDPSKSKSSDGKGFYFGVIIAFIFIFIVFVSNCIYLKAVLDPSTTTDDGCSCTDTENYTQTMYWFNIMFAIVAAAFIIWGIFKLMPKKTQESANAFMAPPPPEYGQQYNQMPNKQYNQPVQGYPPPIASAPQNTGSTASAPQNPSVLQCPNGTFFNQSMGQYQCNYNNI